MRIGFFVLVISVCCFLVFAGCGPSRDAEVVDTRGRAVDSAGRLVLVEQTQTMGSVWVEVDWDDETGWGAVRSITIRGAPVVEEYLEGERKPDYTFDLPEIAFEGMDHVYDGSLGGCFVDIPQSTVYFWIRSGDAETSRATSFRVDFRNRVIHKVVNVEDFVTSEDRYEF